MKNFLLAFIVFLVYSVFGMWYYACNVKGLCTKNDTVNTVNTVVDEQTETPEVKQVVAPKPVIDNLSSDSFAIRDSEGNTIFSFTDNLSITSNNSIITIPRTSRSFKDSIFSFLNKNQDKELVITGLRSNTETENIGLERAKQVKADLEKFGINADKISVEESVREFSFDANGKTLGGLNFTFKTLSKDRLAQIESGIANKILYSGFASKGFKPDNTLRAYALELKNYLDKYPSKSATITGHTDSVGDDIANDWFGMERAKNVKNYLVSLGIVETRLEALSKGETSPIDTNNTLEGRRKNRRIEININ